MGQFSDMLAENNKDKASRAAGEAQRRAESKAAYESSGAAKQIKRAMMTSDRPGVAAVPAVGPGALRGNAKGALAQEIGVEVFDGHVQGDSFGRKTR